MCHYFCTTIVLIYIYTNIIVIYFDYIGKLENETMKPMARSIWTYKEIVIEICPSNRKHITQPFR